MAMTAEGNPMPKRRRRFHGEAAPRRPIAYVPRKRKLIRFLPAAWGFRNWGRGAYGEASEEYRGRCFGW